MELDPSKLHDVDHIYLQWLQRRKHAPSQRTCLSVALILGMFVAPVTALAVLMLYTMIFLPNCVHKDFANPTGREIFASPVPSREILDDLRTWFKDLMTGQFLVMFFVLPIIGLLIILNVGAVAILYVLYSVVTLASFYFASMESGLLMASLPQWMAKWGWPSLVITLVTAVPVALIVYAFSEPGLSDIQSWTLAILAPVIYIASGIYCRNKAPVYLDMRRQGYWEA